MQHLSEGFVLLTAADHIHFLSKKSNQYLIAFLFCVRCLKFTSSTRQGLLSGYKLSSLQSDNLKYLGRTVIIMQSFFTKTSYFKWTPNILYTDQAKTHQKVKIFAALISQSCLNVALWTSFTMKVYVHSKCTASEVSRVVCCSG